MPLLKAVWQRLWQFGETGVLPGDDDETRTKKIILTIAAVFVAPMLVLIGILYLLFNEPFAGLMYVLYGVFMAVNLLVFIQGHRNDYLMAMAMGVSVLPVHLVVALSLGNFINSGAIILWGLAFPVITGLVFFSPRVVTGFFVLFIFNIVVITLVQPYVRQTVNVPPGVNMLIFIINVLCASLLIMAVLAYFMYQRNIAYALLRGEQIKAENLLLNVLPAEIATILKDEQRVIADHFDGASILFADVVGFTPMSATMSPVELVNLLNEVFSYFDVLVDKYHLEKIKTIGDCYMVASGVPRSRPDHAQSLVRMALEMQAYVRDNRFRGRELNFRVGINSGAVVAGVIGRKKFIYDLWGDAVNTASRMESHGTGGIIQITESTYDLIKDDFACEARGTIYVKGKGDMAVWYVTGEKSADTLHDGEQQKRI